MTLNDVRLIELPRILDERGNLSFFENERQVPFPITRAYWIYDVPGGEIRGGHAYNTMKEMVVAISGSFDVVLHDGVNKKTFSLNRSYYGIYIPCGIWRHMENFSTNSLALIVSDQPYNETEYIRNFESFVKLKSQE